MSVLKSPFEMTGSIQGFSFYKPSGSDRVIVRSKGGASRQKIKNSPEFEGLRKHQSEWAGSVKMSRAICSALAQVRHLADFNIPAYMNGFSKKLQALDTENPVGERRIQLSGYKYLLDDFQLDRIHSFASILRVTPSWEIDRQRAQAGVQIPYINTYIHLVNPTNLPYFRIIATLGLVADLHADPQTHQYGSQHPQINGAGIAAYTAWYSTNRVIEAQELNLKFEGDPYQSPGEDVSFVLGIGVEFGKPGTDGQPVEVKRPGAARVLGVR